jgi:hypothetical protein
MVCIYVTDADWLDALRGQPYETVHFWRGSRDNIHLPNGSAFYFKLYGSEFIAGRAQFLGQTVLSISDAWARYTFANGVRSEDELRQKASEVLRLPDGAPLCCLLLRNVRILPVNQYFVVNADEYQPGPFPYRLLEDHNMHRIREEFAHRWQVRFNRAC